MDSEEHRPLKKRVVVRHQQPPPQENRPQEDARVVVRHQQPPPQENRSQEDARVVVRHQQPPPQENRPQEDARVVVRHQQPPPQENRSQEDARVVVRHQQPPPQENRPQEDARVVVRHQQPPPQENRPRVVVRHQQPPPQEEEDDNTEEPPPLPCRYWSLWSAFKSCALLGCYLRVSGNHQHCCFGHYQLAQEYSQQDVAFHYFDGFLSVEHRKSVCILVLLKRLQGLVTGVPDLDQVDGLFTTLPWQLQITPEKAGNWLFFKTPPPRYTSMKCSSLRNIRWKKNPFASIGFKGLEHPPVTYTLFSIDGGDDNHRQLAEEWRLHLFQSNGVSLYCLSNGGGSNFAQPEPDVIMKPNGDTSSKDHDPDPVSKIASSKHHLNLPSTSNSSSVPQVPLGNPQGREEDDNTEEPPSLPCRYWSLRSAIKSCALLGCYLRVSGNHQHCCSGHYQLAQEYSQRDVAFHYFDGVLSAEHRQSVCILVLLKRLQGSVTGVPDLDRVAGLFTTLPWQLQITPEKARNWLFFKTPPSRYTPMNCNSNRAIRWTRNSSTNIGFKGLEHPPVTYQLFLMEGGDGNHRQLAEEWRLHLFQSNGVSLYCLSNGGEFLFAQPDPDVIKKPNGDTSSKDHDPDPVSKKSSSKHHPNLPSTSNSSSVPQVPLGNPQGREEDDNTEEPPPLPCRYWSLWSAFKSCALLGCYLRVSGNHQHCCFEHYQLAQEYSQRDVAFHYFDGFLSAEHRQSVCILVLLRRVLQGLVTGVPDLDRVAGLFTTLPWQLQITPEKAGNWLFFKTPPSRYTPMNCNSNRAIRWTRNSSTNIGFKGLEHPPVTYQLFSIEGGDNNHRQLAKEWRLHLFQSNGVSLYCLSNGGEFLFAQPDPDVIKKPNGDTSSKDHDPDPVSKKSSSKHHPNLPSTSNSSSVPQVPLGNPQGRRLMLSALAVTEGVACRDGETVQLKQIKAKKKTGGPSFALINLAKTLFKVCELRPQDVVFKDRRDAQKMCRFNELSLVCKETMDH